MIQEKHQTKPPPEATSDDIKRSIENTRHRLSEMIEELSQELKMPALVERAIDDVSTDTVSEYGHKAEVIAKEFAESVKRNPVPSILIGVGLFLWLSSPKKKKKADRREPVIEAAPNYQQTTVNPSITL